MSKMKNALAAANDKTPATPPSNNPFIEAATEGGDSPGELLKFVKTRWQIGDDEVLIGTEYVAHIDQLMRAWVKFKDNKVISRVMGKVVDGFKAPPREELGDTDPQTWEKDDKGQPRDPWALQWYLPLVSVESGEVVTFITGSEGGNIAIKNLCLTYGYRNRNGQLPIVALQKRSYKHDKYGHLETPKLAIVGWDGTRKTAPVLSPKDNNLNDQIPW